MLPDDVRHFDSLGLRCYGGRPQGTNVQKLAASLHPRSPPRGSGAASRECAFALLTQADSFGRLAAVVEAMARQTTGCSDAELSLSNTQAVADPASAEIVVPLADGLARLTLRFAETDAAREDWTDADGAWIDLADLRLRELLRQRELREDVASAKSNAHLQRALYTIADLSYADIDVPEMLAGVHAVVARLTYAENFFVACARMR